MGKTDYDNLRLLGTKTTLPKSPKEAILEKVDNPHLASDYLIRFSCPEFTTLCPVTGQPDFAVIRISYIPDSGIVELKSLKLYLASFRNKGIFHEHVTNHILDDFVAASQPISCVVEGDFNMRGGIKTLVRAEYRKS